MQLRRLVVVRPAFCGTVSLAISAPYSCSGSLSTIVVLPLPLPIVRLI